MTGETRSAKRPCTQRVVRIGSLQTPSASHGRTCAGVSATGEVDECRGTSLWERKGKRVS